MHIGMLGANFHLNIQLNVAKAHSCSAQCVSVCWVCVMGLLPDVP